MTPAETDQALDLESDDQSPLMGELDQDRLERLNQAGAQAGGRKNFPTKSTPKKTKSPAAGTTKKIADQSTKQASVRLAAQAALAAGRSLLIAAWPWILGGLVVIIILVAIIFPIVALFTSGEGDSGNRVAVPAQLGQDRPKVQRLTALTGDLESRAQLTAESSADIIKLLDQIQEEVNRTFTGDPLNKILNQLNITRESVKTFEEAITRAINSGEMEVEGNKKVIPIYVKQARNDLLKEFKELRKLIDGAGCDGLPEPNSAGLIHLPDNANYRRYSTFGSYEIQRYQWATPKMICLLSKVGAIWQQKHPGEYLEIGDISEASGGVPIGARGPRHQSHTGGIHADLWTPHLQHADTYGFAFDLAKAREFAQLLRSYKEVRVIYFNDNTLNREGLTSPAGGHDNHWHITVE